MAPPKKLRTYSRGNNSTINCFDALNILFAKNLTARKMGGKVRKPKMKIRVKELSEKVKYVFSDESSLHVNVNDTFDRLLRVPVINNNKKPKDISVHIVSNNISTSVIQHKSIECRSMLSKLRSYSSKNSTSGNDLTNNTLSWFNHPTKSGERITNELEIEEINKDKKFQEEQPKLSGNISSRESPIFLRSKVQLSNENKEFFNAEKKTMHHEGNISLSFNPVFTNSVCEQILVHCSTPLAPTKKNTVIRQPISPISIVGQGVKSCIIESLKEIKSWDNSLNTKTEASKKLDNSLDTMEELVGFMGEYSFVTGKPKNEEESNLDIKTLQDCTASKDLFSIHDLQSLHNNYVKDISSCVSWNHLQKSYLSSLCNNKSLSFNFVTNRRNFKKCAPHESPLDKFSKLDDAQAHDTKLISNEHDLKNESRHSDLYTKQNQLNSELIRKSTGIKSNSSGIKQLSEEIIELKTTNKETKQKKASRKNTLLNNTETNAQAAALSQFYQIADETAFTPMPELSDKIYDTPILDKNSLCLKEQIEVRSIFRDVSEKLVNTSAKASEVELNPAAITLSPQKIVSDNFRVSLNSLKDKSIELQSPKTWRRSRYRQKKGPAIDMTNSPEYNDQLLGINSSDIEEPLQDHPIIKDIVVDLTLNRFSDISNKDSQCESGEQSSKSINISNDSSDAEIINSSLSSPAKVKFGIPLGLLDKMKGKSLPFKTGKNWRRSLYQQKKECYIDLTESPKRGELMNRRHSIKIIPAASERYSRRKTTLQNYAQNNLSIVLDESIDQSVPSRNTEVSLRPLPTVTAKEVVLQRCNQTDAVAFDSLYPDHILNNCRKIGEGVYGEVFLWTNQQDRSTVMKIIPIEGETIVNGEKQKKFHEIISEVVIASELSNLRKNRYNKCPGFCEVQRIACVKGRYTKRLIDLWHEYDSRKGSENDSPEIFHDDQLYIVLSLAHAGQDLESFVFNNATCAVSMFKQVACSLATAEEVLKFEHRDLHWGNVLVRAATDRSKKILNKFKGKQIEIIANGVEATIIDFTLSRIEYQGVVIFNDLGSDPDLFVAEGDYQFDIYRLMKEKNNNDWRKFEPYTNILWLHYILKKSIKELRYKNTKTKIHKKGIEDLKVMENDILNYGSASEFIMSFD